MIIPTTFFIPMSLTAASFRIIAVESVRKLLEKSRPSLICQLIVFPKLYVVATVPNRGRLFGSLPGQLNPILLDQTDVEGLDDWAIFSTFPVAIKSLRNAS